MALFLLFVAMIAVVHTRAEVDTSGVKVYLILLIGSALTVNQRTLKNHTRVVQLACPASNAIPEVATADERTVTSDD